MSAYKAAAELRNQQFKDIFIKRRHGVNSDVYSITGQLDTKMLIQFLGENGKERLAPRLYNFPLEVWFNLVDLQQAIDHNINCSFGEEEWDISTEESNWSVTLLYEEKGTFKIIIEEHLDESEMAFPKKITIKQREWTYLKDCMIPSSLHSSTDVKLGIYAFSELVKDSLEKLICETCSCCKSMNDKTRIYGSRHSCVTNKREKQISLFEKALGEMDPVLFSDSIRRKAKEYDIYIHAPYLLHHTISRFYIASVRALVIEPENVFTSVKGKEEIKLILIIL